MVKRHIYRPRPFIWAYNQVSMTFRSKVLARTSSCLEKPLFWAISANLTTSGRVILTEMVKRHIYGPRPFIWAYNQVSMTFRSKVLARTSSSLEKPLFWAILANLTTSGGVFLTEMVKRHIYGPRSFIWAYNQVSLTFRSKVLARTSSSLGKPLFWAIWPIWSLPVGVF